MMTKLAKLIDVKSIMTLALTLVFCILALKGVLSGQEFLTIFTTVIAFYFGTQAVKKTEPAEVKATERAEPLPDDTGTVNATQPVDQSMANDIHPPDVT